MKKEKTKKRSEYNNPESYDDELDIVYDLLEQAQDIEDEMLEYMEECLEQLVRLIENRFPFYFPEGMVNKEGFRRLAEDLLSKGESRSELGGFLDKMSNNIIDFQSAMIMGMMLSAYNTVADKTAISIGVQRVEVPVETMKAVVLQPWCDDHKTFLDRIKKNTEDMDRELRTVILKGIRNGWSIKQMAEELKKVTGMAMYKAQRLVRTETMAVYSKVTKEIYLENGIEYIEIIGDAACGGICLDYVGEYLPLAEAEVGLDLPPYHPNCACSFCSYIDFGELREEQGEYEE